MENTTENHADDAAKTVDIWMAAGPDMLTRLGAIDADFLEAFKAQLPKFVSGTGRSEEVYVLGVSAKEVEEAAKRGKRHQREIRQGDSFKSAMAASLALGYDNNEVAKALSVDKTKRVAQAEIDHGVGNTVRIRPEATLRGVTLQYEKDVRDL